MKKTVVLPFLALSLFASDEYIPVSELSHSKKQEYNFINKTNINKAVETKTHAVLSQESDDVIEPLEKVEIKETKVNISEKIKEKKEVIPNTKVENKTFVKEYKKENILKDEVKYSDNSFSKDFSVTPKISYMNVTTDLGDYELDKTHEIIPEISFMYKKHILKTEYFNVNTKLFDIIDFDTTGYKLAYLYNFYNANIGLAYNKYNFKISLLGESIKDSEEFASLEVHLKNKENQILVEYGGFYGKNDSDIKNAYEYYLNLGYEVIKNDKLIFTLGYKNRTIEIDESDNLEYKGPTIGVSSTF